MKRGLGRERRRIQRKWVKKNKNPLLLVGTTLLSVILLIFIITTVVYFMNTAIVRSESDWDRLSPAITRIIVLKSSCNYGFDALDLSRFDGLKEVKVGDECFKNVTTVNITGLSQLESVEIGMNSFTQHKNSWGNDPNRHFYLKNCPKLKSLKMGRYSFSDYTVIEIENVDALEVIEMGDLDYWSCNFNYASLELKSILIHRE